MSDTEIDFKLRPNLTFTGNYGPLTAEDVKFSFERFIKADASGKKVDYASDWAALDRVDFTEDELAEIDQFATDGGINLWAESSRE